MSTFGHTTLEGTHGTSTSNKKRTWKLTLPEAGSISEILVYVEATKAGEQGIRGVVYDDDGTAGAPKTLLGVTADRVYKSTEGAGWFVLTFAEPLKLAAGEYWIGYHVGTTSEVIGIRYQSVGGTMVRSANADTYSDGAANPFGTPETETIDYSIYAVYGPTYIDTGAGTATAEGSGSGSTSTTFTDTASGSATATGSSTDSYTPPGSTFTDTAAGTVTASGSATEAYTGAKVDAMSGTVTASGSSMESCTVAGAPVTHTDAQTGIAHASGSRIESWGVEGANPPEVTGGASTTQLRGVSPELRSIDPSECWIRHIVRGQEGDPSAMPVARVHFVRSDVMTGEDGLNTRQGWQQGEVALVLSDDGSFALVLPNAAGDDGVLHRRRFGVVTDENYEPGEEWLEFWRDPNDLIFVGTPTDYEKTSSTVTIKGADLPTVLAGALSSDVDVWDAAGPADVLHHYTRLPVLAYGSALTVAQVGPAGAWSPGYEQALADVATDCWTAEAQLRWTSPRPTKAADSYLRLTVGGLVLRVDLYEGDVTLEGDDYLERAVKGKALGLVLPGAVSLRIVVRYDHVFAFVAGDLVAEFRRLPV